MNCCMCTKLATVLDTEYNEGYCDKHAEEYRVLDGPHRKLDNTEQKGN